MEMSPPGIGVFEASFAVIERGAAVGSSVDVDFGARKTKAPRLRRDLQTSPVPLNDVVFADHTFVGRLSPVHRVTFHVAVKG